MHKLVWACGLACLLLGASAARAQDYDGETLSAPKSGRLTERVPVRESEQVSPRFLRLQRAIKRSEERRQRIEARKWYGVSALRPLRNPNQFNNTLYGVQYWPMIPLHARAVY